MTDESRRRVHRRQPIILVLDDDKEFVARPLPWQARNDLGEEVLQQNVAVTNEAVRLLRDEGGSITVEAKLQESLKDPFEVLRKGYPESNAEDFEGLSFDEIFELIHAALDVNHLDRLWRILDPNWIPPTSNGGETSSPGEMLETTGPKIESTEDFSSQESIETPLSISPMER